MIRSEGINIWLKEDPDLKEARCLRREGAQMYRRGMRIRPLSGATAQNRMAHIEHRSAGIALSRVIRYSKRFSGGLSPNGAPAGCGNAGDLGA